VTGLIDYISDWVKNQQNISAQRGLWTGGQVWEGGHPTGMGLADALSKYVSSLSTSDLPGGGPNYALLETLDRIRRSERTPIKWPGQGLFQRAGGPTEQTAHRLMDVERRQSLWDEANAKRSAARGLFQDVVDHKSGKTPLRPDRAIRKEELAYKTLREFEAAKEIAKRFGVDVEQQRPQGVREGQEERQPKSVWDRPEYFFREMMRDAPKYRKEELPEDPLALRRLITGAEEPPGLREVMSGSARKGGAEGVKDVLHSLEYHGLDRPEDFSGWEWFDPHAPADVTPLLSKSITPSEKGWQWSLEPALNDPKQYWVLGSPPGSVNWHTFTDQASPLPDALKNLHDLRTNPP
jgi:hypothetical protein